VDQCRSLRIPGRHGQGQGTHALSLDIRAGRFRLLPEQGDELMESRRIFRADGEMGRVFAENMLVQVGELANVCP
jgi:hypothetical protein